MIYLSIRPDAIDNYLQDYLEVSFKDTILTLSLLVLFILNFRIYIKIKNNEKNLIKLLGQKQLLNF